MTGRALQGYISLESLIHATSGPRDQQRKLSRLSAASHCCQFDMVEAPAERGEARGDRVTGEDEGRDGAGPSGDRRVGGGDRRDRRGIDVTDDHSVDDVDAEVDNDGPVSNHVASNKPRMAGGNGDDVRLACD